MHTFSVLVGSKTVNMLDSPKAITKLERNDMPSLRLVHAKYSNQKHIIPESVYSCFDNPG